MGLILVRFACPLLPELLTQSGIADYPALDGPKKEFVPTVDDEGFPRPGDPGVEQFPAKNRDILMGQEQENLPKFRALRFMDVDGVRGLPGRQASQGDWPDSFVIRMWEPGLEEALIIGPDDAGVAVEEVLGIIVAQNDDRHARIAVLACSDQPAAAKNGFRQTVNAFDPAHSFPQGAENPALSQFLEGGLR